MSRRGRSACEDAMRAVMLGPTTALSERRVFPGQLPHLQHDVTRAIAG